MEGLLIPLKHSITKRSTLPCCRPAVLGYFFLRGGVRLRLNGVLSGGRPLGFVIVTDFTVEADVEVGGDTEPVLSTGPCLSLVVILLDGALRTNLLRIEISPEVQGRKDSPD